jgi:hypothetical protein
MMFAPTSGLMILKVLFAYKASVLSLKASYYNGPYIGLLIVA